MTLRVVLWLLSACGLAVGAEATQLPRTRQIQQLRTTLQQNWTRVNNVDVHESMNATSFCHIADLNFYSRVAATGERFSVPGLPLQAASAIALAIEHLNAGDGSVVPEVEGLNRRCDVRFTPEFLDTAVSPSHAVDQVIDVVGRKERQPCAFLGAGLSTVSMATATVSGLKGFPQLSWLSVSSKLSDAQQFPLFARLAPPVETLMGARLELIYTALGARHLAWIYSDDPAVVDETNAMQAIAREKYPDLVLQLIPYAGAMSEATAKTVIGNLKRTELRYVHLSSGLYDVEPLMLEAAQQGVAGSGRYVWILRRTPLTNEGALIRPEFPPGDPLPLALKGSIRFEPLIGAPGIARFDSFMDAWKALGTDEDTSYLQSMLPKYPGSSTYRAVLDASAFENPSPFVAAAYDATVLLGLAACGSTTQFFTGEEMYESMMNTSFVGATGAVGLDPETKARVKHAGMYQLMNSILTELPNGNVSIMEAEVGFFNGSEWEMKADITFNDGSTIIPPDLPPAREDSHFLDSGLRSFGLIAAGFVVLVAMGMSLWTSHFANRVRVIRAAQPLFLHLICIGTGLMGSAIIPLSFDDGFVSMEAANVACLVFPWLLALGWAISFSALFSKTMRVNKLFHNPSFRRITVSASDVMRPMALLLVANVLILLLWSLLSPLQYERVVLAQDQFGRPSGSHGRCASEHFWWFFIPLASLNFAALVVANQQAYVARKISTEFAESDYIARAMSLIVVVAVLVIPVAMMADTNTNMHFFISLCFVCTVALSLLFYIFLPKIALHLRGNESMSTAIRSSVVATKSTMSFDSDTIPKLEDNPSEGELVLLHPKLAAADEERILILTQENEELIRQNAHLRARNRSLSREDSPDSGPDC